MLLHFSLTDQPIDIVSLAEQLHDPAAGAEVTFDGRVRNRNDGHVVERLEYQAYPALALKMGRRILDEEARKHDIVAAVAIHRTGLLEIGESAVWVGVASSHRAAAFDAARAIMERLKYELPVWKREHYADGSTGWVGPDNTSADTGKPTDDIPEWRAELEEIWISPGHDFRGHHGGARGDHGSESVPVVECVAGMGLRCRMRVAVALVGPQLLGLAAQVVGDHRVGGVEDGLGGSVVLLEHDHGGVRERLLELEDVPDVRTSEAVN